MEARLTFVTAVLAVALVSCGDDAGRAAGGSALLGVGEIVDLSVSFTVENLNRSLVPCLTDGARYTLSGHIVGPSAAMRDGAAATLYLHGAAVPEATWRMPAPGSDYGLEQARRGHVSVTLDRLSYGSSPTPNGLLTCHGGQADIAHQIVDQLRAGTYGSAAPVRFSRIALAGHSAGQVIAEIAAYSFGDIDALVVGGWGDPNATIEGAFVLLPTIQVCATGGEPKRPRQRGWFKGSDDVTLFELPDTGHMMMLERTAPELRARVSEWLRERGF